MTRLPAPRNDSEGQMVDLCLRLPRRVASQLVERADEYNLPLQALVLAALQAELRQRHDPE